jgi:hypothetical protein
MKRNRMSYALTLAALGAVALGTTAVPAVATGGILFYNANTGAGATGRIDEAGNFITLRVYPAGSFSKWTHVVATMSCNP